jgi:autotransporter translocation and assembly factor TamB
MGDAPPTMTFPRHLRRLAVVFGKTVVYVVAAALLLIVAGLVILETGWAKNQLRNLIVRQANEYLSATLEIGRLEGSLVRGIQLGDIRLSRGGRTLVAIDDVSLSYSIRELLQRGTVIRRIRLTRPRVEMSRTADGRWDLTTLVKREAREEKNTGPGRPIEIESIEVQGGSVTLHAPLDFGAAHAPTRYESLDVRGAFVYRPVHWRLTFAHVSFRGYEPDLTMNDVAGALESGPDAFVFHDLAVRTPTSAFTIAGPIRRGAAPTTLGLAVHAERFRFQEWSGVLRGLKNIAVESSFDTTLTGPLARLDTTLRLQSTAGAIAGSFALDTTVPGWHGTGAVDITRLNLAGWLNRPDRPSDITGHVTFDLALDLGRHFPRGSYSFAGPHVRFMTYAADDLKARGTITAADVHVDQATARAYGAAIALTPSTIGVDDPYPFHFVGTAAGVDLRRVPPNVPVPHVQSVLTFDYDVTGRFAQPYIAGHAAFARSDFLGAVVEPGAVGTIDTLADPLEFSGDGEVRGVDLHRLGAGLEVAWLQEPRYAGTVSGRFRVDGSGTDRESLAMTASGRLSRADLFRGRLFAADVSLSIEGGTLSTTYNGRFAGVDPSIPLADERFAASITGTANVRATVRDLLTRTPDAADYDVDGTMTLGPSAIRDLHVDRAAATGAFRDGALALQRLEIAGPAIEATGSGRVALVDDGASDLRYGVVRADLAQLQPIIGRTMAGQVATAGRLTGPHSALRFQGNGTVNRLEASGVGALTLTGEYDVTLPSGDATGATARVTARGTFLTVAGQALQTAEGTVTLSNRRVGFDLSAAQANGRHASAQGEVVWHPDASAVDVARVDVSIGSVPWRLAPGPSNARIAWTADGISVSPVQFVVSSDASQRIDVAGTWRTDGNGALRITASHVFLETLQGAFQQPARYGGVLDMDATLRGTREHPTILARVTVANGRIQRFSYERLSSRVDFADGMFHIDARLDQSPGTWLTAAGDVPMALFNRSLPERNLNVAIASSPIDMAVLEGLTNVVRNVHGEMRLDVHAIGTSRDPHFQGRVELAGATFLVAASGSMYKNGRATIQLASDRITVTSLHLEDAQGDPLEVLGSLGTHELTVGNLAIDVTARRFEVIHNPFGRLDIDTALQLRGRFEEPHVAGDITIVGEEVKVDEILQEALFQPYSTEPAPGLTEVDPIAALNPWDRLMLDVALHVPQTLRLSGQNVQVSPGTPIGLGDINLRVGGDLWLYKDPGQPLAVTGSLDSISGRYGFQGRQFDVDETSSINFHGTTNPELFVAVTRVISGVETRVTLTGTVTNPELHLSSNPPLDTTDILSLIVFNASMNDLTAAQQQELAVRAGTLAAGFIATPLVSAIQRSLGLETLGIEPAGDLGTGPKVTIGEELAPGLVARFSRQFGQEPYDEAIVEYYLSRLFRIRATFSDAGTLVARSPFRRIERAGIDFLFFFSF